MSQAGRIGALAPNPSGGFIWTDNSGSFTAAAGHGYFLTAASTATLPAAPAEGNTIEFIVTAAATMTIQASPGKFIRLGNVITVASGTCVSNIIGNAITLVYQAASLTWFAKSAVGSWTLT